MENNINEIIHVVASLIRALPNDTISTCMRDALLDRLEEVRSGKDN